MTKVGFKNNNVYLILIPFLQWPVCPGIKQWYHINATGAAEEIKNGIKKTFDHYW